MDKKIETFLQEIHSLPDEQLDKKQLESNLEMLVSASPKISTDLEFKKKLQARLDNIIEFKQGNSTVKKIAYLKVLFPIFACFILVVGVFSMIDIKLFNGDASTLAPIQSELAISSSLAIDEEPDVNPETELKQNDLPEPENPLTIKQQILAKAAEKKARAQENTTETSNIASEVVPDKLDNQREPASTIVNPETDNTQTEDAQLDGNTAVLDDATDSFATQLKGIPTINDTPDTDLNTIDSSLDISNDDVNILETLLGPLGTETTGSGVESIIAEDSDISREMFKQSCEAFEGSIQTQSGAMLCIKNEVNICSRVDYENRKCEYLE